MSEISPYGRNDNSLRHFELECNGGEKSYSHVLGTLNDICDSRE